MHKLVIITQKQCYFLYENKTTIRLKTKINRFVLKIEEKPVGNTYIQTFRPKIMPKVIVSDACFTS
jgi:hypothetical protein